MSRRAQNMSAHSGHAYVPNVGLSYGSCQESSCGRIKRALTLFTEHEKVEPADEGKFTAGIIYTKNESNGTSGKKFYETVNDICTLLAYS